MPDPDRIERTLMERDSLAAAFPMFRIAGALAWRTTRRPLQPTNVRIQVSAQAGFAEEFESSR
jgi:hypothetical protein